MPANVCFSLIASTASATIAIAALLGGGPALAQSPPARPPSLAGQPKLSSAGKHGVAAAQGQAIPAADLMPVLHARQNGVIRCQAQIGELATRVIDTQAYSALSTWSTARPDQHQFQSVVALRYPNAPAAPNAAAILTATPGGEAGCDSAVVQIYPSTHGCKTLAEGLAARGYSAVGDLTGFIVYQDPAKQRAMLLPSGKQCVIVAFQSRLSLN
ncbi:MAG: hypothetical protein ACRCUE_13890 [Bosea sp. (in: a-proteobacteria)]